MLFKIENTDLAKCIFAGRPMISLLIALPQWLQKITFTNTELVAALLSFWCVWLAAKNNILNWPVAMAGSLLYVVVFYQGALYSDAFLNVIFLGFQAFGWYKWSRRGLLNKTLKDAEKQSIETLSQPIVANLKQWLPVFIIGVILYVPWTLFVKSGTIQQWISPGSYQPPRFLYIDAALFILSICALYMQGKRWIQHWYVWVLVDVVYVPMYVLNRNFITAVLYLVYIPMAIKGYQLWKANLRERTTVD